MTGIVFTGRLSRIGSIARALEIVTEMVLDMEINETDYLAQVEVHDLFPKLTETIKSNTYVNLNFKQCLKKIIKSADKEISVLLNDEESYEVFTIIMNALEIANELNAIDADDNIILKLYNHQPALAEKYTREIGLPNISWILSAITGLEHSHLILRDDIEDYKAGELISTIYRIFNFIEDIHREECLTKLLKDLRTVPFNCSIIAQSELYISLYQLKGLRSIGTSHIKNLLNKTEKFVLSIKDNQVYGKVHGGLDNFQSICRYLDGDDIKSVRNILHHTEEICTN